MSVHPAPLRFHARIARQLADPVLQGALKKAKPLFTAKRARGMVSLADDGLDFEALRAAARDIKNRVLADLDVWLAIFEERALAAGAEVLWARDGDEAARLIVDLARREGVRTVTKSKSMVSEEVRLNDALTAAGIRPVETDLGEYVVQLAGEPPSHIIAPAVHKTVGQVEALFAEKHGRPEVLRTSADIPALAREARQVLRRDFLAADMGVSGANFLIAETGSAALVTNEGNGRMVTTLPRVHVVVAGIEKLVPTLADFASLMRLLPRSATGQAISNYVSVLTGPRREDDLDGPQKTVFVLVDNGRSALLATPYEAMLRCIRCGACMNHCPVYFALGGHAWDWVYPGPMGSVLTPLLKGLSQAPELPHASTGCGQCADVCPVDIPLPSLMHRLREDQRRAGLVSRRERWQLFLWGWLARHPALYRPAAARLARYLRWLADGSGRIRVSGLFPAWTAGRDLPVSSGRTFQELYAARKRT